MLWRPPPQVDQGPRIGSDSAPMWTMDARSAVVSGSKWTAGSLACITRIGQTPSSHRHWRRDCDVTSR